MSYVFRGRLCGYICDECSEPLARATVRLYRSRSDEVTARAVARPAETFAILDEREVEERSGDLLGEGKTDELGSFAVELEKRYEGEPFEVDVYLERPPREKADQDTKPIQFSITTLQPRWKQTEGGYLAVWEYCLSAKYWCRILAHFGIWTICGRLVTCEQRAPIPGATVRAFDADLWEDDPLGSAVTDGSGHFLISYLTSTFEKTPLSPFFNIELWPGPDVYFSAELGGSTILKEDRSTGRSPGRENVGHCLCVEICAPGVTIGDPETVPHWMQVEDFAIHPNAGLPGSSFSAEGYAGNPSTGAFVFGGGVHLHGNSPLRNAATSNSVEYRFLIGEWTWSPPGDDPAAIPSVAPASLTPVTQIQSTLVGYVEYTDGNGTIQWAPVYIDASDVGPGGWIKVDGKAITVPMYNPPGSTAVVNVAPSNWLRTFDLVVLNSPAITAAHPAKLPGGWPKSQAGQSLATAQQEPIRRYTLRFEARDSVTTALLGSDQLDSVVLDNSPVAVALDLVELQANACNPLAGQSTAHILYTIDHPHLRSFSISIANNNGTVHSPPQTPSGAFTAGAFLFRGGASGAGGSPVNISADPPCAYAVTLSWLTRRYYDISHSTQVLYCK